MRDVTYHHSDKLLRLVSRENPLWKRYTISVLLIAGWTGFVKTLIPGIELVDLAMTYLLANVLIAVRYGQGPSILSAILSVALFDFFFVPPFLTFTVDESKYWITFLIMLLVTILTNRLTIESRRSAKKAYEAEKKAKLEQLINLLLSSVSHDLRTPLTSIYGAAATLLTPKPQLSEEDRQSLLETIRGESGRLNRLVENILQITKIEAGNTHLRKELHSLEEIIGNALNRLEPMFRDRQVETTIPEELPLVPLDNLLIEQVLVNLLENALRYTPPSSPIELRVSQDREQIRVEILDRGPGISLEEQVRIFEKFYRQGNEDNWGSGLGLAICRGILEIHQGKIGMNNRQGGGCVFYFSLPIISNSPEPIVDS